MDTSIELAWCYEILELPAHATQQEIKAAYRKLARQYHPDLNPGDRTAEARFKLIAIAYQTLVAALWQAPQATRRESVNTTSAQSNTATPPAPTSSRVRIHVKHPAQTKKSHTSLSAEDKWLKVSTINQIYGQLKRKNWQQAVDVAEKLVSHFPDDPDSHQWLALTYHRCARSLIERYQYEQARIYLKKALHSDPHNRQLWLEIDRDYKNMERRLQL